MNISQSVTIMQDTLTGRTARVCEGVIERLTPTMIVVRNEHGNIARFKRATCKVVGYCYPHCTYHVVPLTLSWLTVQA